ncbi:hypothetical protein EMCRGX_G019028 [Ephydatia muelleri]|eukprot:Em0011g1025a
MGNACNCVRNQTQEEDDEALLRGLMEENERLRGPPPPYQPQAPAYTYPQMLEQQRLQFVQRLTLIQCLPHGVYDTKTTSSEKKGEIRECPICMMEFSVGDPIRFLPCMHYYHMKCADEWLMRSFTCPSCMQRVDIGLGTTFHMHQGRAVARRHSNSSVSSSSSNSSREHLVPGPSTPQRLAGAGSSRSHSPPQSPTRVRQEAFGETSVKKSN